MRRPGRLKWRTYPRRSWATIRRDIRGGAAAAGVGTATIDSPASMHVSTIGVAAILGEIRSMTAQEQDRPSDNEDGRPDW